MPIYDKLPPAAAANTADAAAFSSGNSPMASMTIELEWTEHVSPIDQISDEALEAAADMTNQAAFTFVACTALSLCTL